MSIYDVVYYLQDYGFFQVIVPFMITYLVVFALLEKTHVFGRGKTTLNGILAILLSLTVISSTNVADFLSQYLSNITIGLVFISVAVLVFMSALSIDNTPLKFIAVIFSILTVLWALFETRYFHTQLGGQFFGALGDIFYYLKPVMQNVLVFGLIAIVIAASFIIFSRGNSGGP